jgi:hypothetical protein
LESHNLVKERLLSTASLLGATGCGVVAIIWKMVLFSKRKETRQEDGDHAKGEASGEGAEVVQCRRPLAPQGTAIHALEDCHIDSINRHDRSITLRHGDELDVGWLNYGPVLLQTDAAMAALGATTLPVLTP